MFEWFREIGEEIGGIDSAAAKKERLEKKELKKTNRYIFSSGTKALIIVLGAVYLLMAGTMIVTLKGMPETTLQIVKYALMSIIDIVVLFSLIFGKKKGEIIALVGGIIFVVGLFFSTVLM